MSSPFYRIPLNDFRKRPVDLASLAAGKVVLVVNVASKCGFATQYSGLEKLYQAHKDKGLVIIGVPSNDFAQEPLEGEEVVESCKLNFGVTFPIMEKSHVNGKDEHPLFAFLKSEKPGVLGLKMVKWNFEKFLIDKNGTPIERFSSLATPESIEPHIVKLLSQ
ncbi:thioredoxin-like protein [Zopfochytrium polystomum]|nr:thioredoxin-like protein [Zopfochytrium polystomum]